MPVIVDTLSFSLRRLLRNPQPSQRLIIETTLVLALFEIGWRVNSLITRIKINPELHLPIIGAATCFILIVYYGTSGEVTPLRLLTLLFPLFPRMRSRSRELRFGSYTESSQERKENVRPAEESATLPGAINSIQHADIERLFEGSARAAGKLAAKMDRRINTMLILGVFVGGVGVGVWYYSFPTISKDLTTPMLISQLVPRITILFFVELLAGFFLRQYRIGVEDLKYFLDLQRKAEGQRVAYTIVFGHLNDVATKKKFVQTLIDHPLSVLRKGESTASLEAMKAEENIALKAVSVLGDQLEHATRLLRSDKGKP